MAATFNMHEAKTHFSKLVERALAGEDIVVAKAGKPSVRLVPVEAGLTRKRQPGGWPELANIPDSVWFDPLPDEDLAYIDDRPKAERR